MIDIERKLNTVRKDEMYRPDIVIVQGDTDSDYIVALVAKMM
jgi:UDP-N-acetylglucosamine 2-epimerase